MSAHGADRLVKVVPLAGGNEYPPGAGIPQWKVSELAVRYERLPGELLFVIRPGERYPRSNASHAHGAGSGQS